MLRVFRPVKIQRLRPDLNPLTWVSEAVHECNTSAVVTIMRISEFIGSRTRLSVSGSQNVFVCWSSSCTI